MIIRTLVILTILFVIDLYVFQGIKYLVRNLQPSAIRLIYFSFWGVTAFCFAVLLAGLIVDWHDWPKPIRTYSFAFVFVTYFSKIFLVFFMVIDDVYRLFQWIYRNVSEWLSASANNPTSVIRHGISRSDFIIRLGMFIAALPFFALILGMIKGKYEYQVRKVKLSFSNLPESFKGFRILQISDIHTGSFMDKAPLEKAVRMINELQPDVIFFTGDLVNDLHREVLPYMDTLSGMKSKHGIYSILGNHDYGDYYQWQSQEEKRVNLENLISAHHDLGWNLLLDEHRHITINGERISVIGVQNWSARMNFARYGNLQKAIDGIEFSPVNILLSHDPSHWRAEVMGKIKEIDLTLSGHTHGFQFGVDIPGIKWSPVQYIYKEWSDLYSQDKQYLYVNRGLGFLGYPGRVGILPEITVFELNKT